MSAGIIDIQSMPLVRGRRAAGSPPPSYTSIRVRVETRDALAAAAQTVGLSLSGYLDDLAAKEWRERALAELREERIAAFQDPTFVAEMEQWHAADDGMELTDDGWPEFND